MTRRTSDVAVCCSNDSDSSLASRAAFASSPAADEPRGRAVPIPLGRFGAAGLRRRGLVDPALERPRMALHQDSAGHRSGSNWQVGSGLGNVRFGSKADSCTAAKRSHSMRLAAGSVTNFLCASCFRKACWRSRPELGDMEPSRRSRKHNMLPASAAKSHRSPYTCR